MNYYNRHLGDYYRDASHLSLLEHGAYTVLLDVYYTTETGIPDERKYRITRARTDEERAAVDAVLNDFFHFEYGIWKNHRAEREIEGAQERIERARENGKKGGRPAKNKGCAYELEIQAKPKENPTLFVSYPIPNPDQSSPITNNQSQVKSIESTNVDLSTKPEKLALQDEDENPKVPACPHKAIIAAYHEILPELRQVRDWNETRSRLLAKRWRESSLRQSLDWWKQFFSYVGQSDFLMGRIDGGNRRAFDCDLEWLIRPTNFTKVLEGKYENKQVTA